MYMEMKNIYNYVRRFSKVSISKQKNRTQKIEAIQLIFICFW